MSYSAYRDESSHCGWDRSRDRITTEQPGSSLHISYATLHVDPSCPEQNDLSEFTLAFLTRTVW
jgi:hypothetical protein